MRQHKQNRVYKSALSPPPSIPLQTSGVATMRFAHAGQTKPAAQQTAKRINICIHIFIVV